MNGCEEERRASYPELLGAIARIDERTQMILEGQEKLASKESVENLQSRFDSHISSHAMWLGLAVALLVGVAGVLAAFQSEEASNVVHSTVRTSGE